MSETPERWLSELYRESAREEPPPLLDARILAASRKGFRNRNSRFAIFWGAPLAAAAVVVVTVSLVIAMRDDAAITKESVSEVSAQADAPKLETPREISRKESGPAIDVAKQRRDELLYKPDAASQSREPQAPTAAERRAEAPGPAPLVKAEPAEPAAASPPIASPSAPLSATEARERAPGQAAQALPPAGSALGKLSAPRDASPEQRRADSFESDHRASPQAKSTSAAEDVRQLESGAMNQVATPEAWLERIVKLRNEGKIIEAKQSLALFKRHYPDHPLPETLKDL